MHRSTTPSRAWRRRNAPTYWRATSAGHARTASGSSLSLPDVDLRAIRMPGLVALVVTAIAAATLSVIGSTQAHVASTSYAVPDSASSEARAADAQDAVLTDDAAAQAAAVVPATDVSKARYGVDVSWPQCGRDLPDMTLDFAVVGLTKGHASTVNPCVKEQVAWARSQELALNLYVVPSGPSAAVQARASRLAQCPAGVADCSAYSAGVVQAKDALRAAKAAKISAHSIWLDVEESVYGTLWSEDTAANVSVLKGWIDTLRAAGTEVGVYSTGGYWTMITDDWQADVPQWVAVGLAGIDAARTACDTGAFTTGPVVMTQWLTGPYDGNLLCAQTKPKATARAAAFFPRTWAHLKGLPVDDIMTIPVPHPEIEAQLALLAQAEADAKAKHEAEVKAKKDKKDKANAATPVKKPKPTPKPATPAQPPASSTPTPTPTADPTPTDTTTVQAAQRHV